MPVTVAGRTFATTEDLRGRSVGHACAECGGHPAADKPALGAPVPWALAPPGWRASSPAALSGARAWAAAPVAPSAQGGGLGAAAPVRVPASVLVDQLPRGLPDLVLNGLRAVLRTQDLAAVCDTIASGPMPAWASAAIDASKTAHDLLPEMPVLTRDDLRNACTAALRAGLSVPTPGAGLPPVAPRTDIEALLRLLRTADGVLLPLTLSVRGGGAVEIGIPAVVSFERGMLRWSAAGGAGDVRAEQAGPTTIRLVFGDEDMRRGALTWMPNQKFYVVVDVAAAEVVGGMWNDMPIDRGPVIIEGAKFPAGEAKKGGSALPLLAAGGVLIALLSQ